MKTSFANSSLATWLTRAVTALRNRNRVLVTDAALPMQNMPQIRSEWDYRPRDAVRQDAAFECEGARPSETAGASTSKENDDVWFNFTNAEPTVDQAPITAPLSEDAGKV